MKFLKRYNLQYVVFGIFYLIEVLLLPFIAGFCLIARFKKKKIDVGLGPEPLINNVYHKRALTKYGYEAETFVADVYYITSDFDIIIGRNLNKICDKIVLGGLIRKVLTPFRSLYTFVLSIWRYKCVYIYFSGGPLGVLGSCLWRLEPYLYQLAGVKVVVMPYGADVQDLLRTRHLLFRHVMAKQYPRHRFARRTIERKIDLWTCQADHVISGCDWIEYMYYWDTLLLAHFSIDTDLWKPSTSEAETAKNADEPFRILHAPNHRHVKGTEFFIQAVEELRNEGLPVELVIIEKMPNEKIRECMETVDVVADQLIIGWYGMIAIEGMSMGKPVLCYLREDLQQFYVDAGIVAENEIPLIHCTMHNVKEKIRELVDDRKKVVEIGKKSRVFVMNHHSVEAIGKVFDEINGQIGVKKCLGV
ncbi:MAG: hypothetical protein K940chlam7_01827 [Chlamydiae bacterium]|nr:hypothetical protein [Chlamydiota bacterium]